MSKPPEKKKKGKKCKWRMKMLEAEEASFICINNSFWSQILVNLYYKYFLLNKSEEMLLNACGTEKKMRS